MASYRDVVRDDSGYQRPVSGAAVYLLKEDNTLATAAFNPVATDDFGVFEFTGVPDDVYALDIRLGGVSYAKQSVTVGTPPQFTGATGPSNNTRLTLALLKAAAITDKTSLYDGSLWTWTLGDYTGRADDVNVVKADSTALSVGAWVRQISEQVYLRNFPGCDPTGATSSVAAFNAALAAGKRVLGTPGDVYLLSGPVVVPSDREVIGNGASLKIAPNVIGLRLDNERGAVRGWTIIGNGGLYAVLNTGKFNAFTDNICTGNIGHYFFSTGAEHVTATGNRVDGLTADTEITTAIVAEGSRHITITNNEFREIPVGWSVQVRNGSENFTVSNNTFLQTQWSDTKTANAGQTVFTFTLGQKCFLRKIQINGKPLSPGLGPAYTVSGDGPTYTVTFAGGRMAGEIVKLVGYRGAENIQVNTGARFGTITGNTVDGTADSGIIAFGANITISSNMVRNCAYAGIAIYGDQDGITVVGNTVIDCAQMDDGVSSPDFPELSSPFAGAILASGSAATITGNTIRNPAGTMRYAIKVNKTDMTLRTDGTPTINISGNILDGIYAEGKLSMPNQQTGQRVNSVAVDGPLVSYPALNLDAPWVEFPASSGRFQPADTDYFTVSGSTMTRAVRDTSVKLGGVASLQTVPGEFIDFTLTAAAMLFNCVVTVSFWAKATGGSSLVEVITALEVLEQPLGALITDTNWRQYSISFAFTPNLEKMIRIRCSGNPGSSGNIQHIQISGRRM